MHAQSWLSLFRVRGSGREDRPDGTYAVAFVSYGPGSTLTYTELLAARVLEARHRVVAVTDIWVDSEASRDAGRSLWAIPKQLGDLDVEDHGLGPAAHTALAARADGGTVASAEFASLPGAAVVRTPAAAEVRQPGPRGEVSTPVRGSARALPALGTWDFASDGPLSYLAGRRPLASFRLSGVRLRMG